jgi:SAM-dependent methyltransferase
MHREALEEMTKILDRIDLQGARLLDVGSFDVNGTYRPTVTRRGWSYTGLDITGGPNVDVVATTPYMFPLLGGWYDIVISGSTMEHVEEPWSWIPELVRVLRPGGVLAIITHWSFPEHRYPIDCWRILPDGMKHLFDLTKSLADYDIRIVNPTDIVGVARKKIDAY